MPSPRSMSRQKIGSRKKSTQASQYRVGRNGRMETAASSTTRASLAIRAAIAPSAAPRGESVTVDRNSAIAATPNIDTVMKATAPSSRRVNSVGDSVTPESEVTPSGSPSAAGVPVPNRTTPVTYEVNTTATTAMSTNAVTDTSLATSSRVRPTGRISRYRSVPALASPATESPASTATAIGRKTGTTNAIAAAGNSEPSRSTADRN